MSEPGSPAAEPAAVRDPALWRDRRLHVLLGAAALLRLVFGLALWQGDGTVRALIADAEYYDAWARTTAAGETFRPGRPHWLPPLYPWILSALYGAGASALGLVLALQSLVGVAVTALVVAIANRVTTRGAALAAGWLWLLFLPAAFFETRLLGVNAALPLVAVALLLGLSGARALERDAPLGPRFLLCGLLCGVACLARPNLLLLPPLAGLGGLAATFLGSDAKRARLLPAAIALLLGLAAGIAPGMLSNLERSDQRVLVSANGGVNFWFGNNAEAHGTFHAPGPEWSEIRTQRDVSVARAAEALGRADLNETEASAWWFDRGLVWLRAEPAAAARLVGLKLADTFSSSEFGIQAAPAASRDLAPALWLAPLPFGLLLALAALGFGRVRRSAGALPTGVLLGWIVGGVLGGLIYFTYSRFRLPWMLAGMPFAGAGCLVLLDAVRGRARPSIAAGLAAALLLAQSFVPFEGDYPRLLRANGLVSAAMAAERLGEQDARRAPLERALELVPGNAKALHELARLEWTEGDPTEAARLLEIAVALPVDYPPAVLELANLIGTSRDPALADRPRAIALLEQVLGRLNPSDPVAAMADQLLERLR